MPDERFDIYFSGKLMDGQDPAAAREQVGRLFKASDTQLARLFSGKPVAIKKGVDMDTAVQYRVALRKVGALVDIRPAGAGAAPAAKPARPARPQAVAGMTLAAANSGSLEGYAPKVEPAPLPDISGLGLSSPGGDLDESPPLPEVAIETDDLDLVEGQEWSLEDCQPELLPLPLPDISELDMDKPGATLDTAPEPPPLPLPDIDAMDLATPDDRHDKSPEPPPVPLPDISAMTLEETGTEAQEPEPK